MRLFLSLVKEEIECKKCLLLYLLIFALFGTILLFFFDSRSAFLAKENQTESCVYYMKKISLYGGFGGVLFLLFSVMLIGLRLKSKKIINATLCAIMTSSLAGLTANAIKLPLGRPRPKVMLKREAIDGIYGPSFNARYQSFPSAHAACAFGAAAGLSCVFPPAAITAFFLAGLIAVSRYLTLNHYPSDLFFSMLLGISYGIILAGAIKRYCEIRKDNTEHLS